jgi:outer membrane protein OmpA-like peptidoglycan-associated protein
MRRSRKNTQLDDEAQWISLSDLMTSLMLCFLLIGVIYMLKLQHTSKKLEQVQNVENLINTTRQGIHAELKKVFDTNAKKWGAELSPDLTLRFVNPESLFDTGQSVLKPSYKASLQEFFPQYIHTMMQEKYRNQIKEIRIEGHTSSKWTDNTTSDIAYFLNMELSQRRTRETLDYLMNNTYLNEEEKDWLKRHFRAIGFSSAKPLNKNGEPTTNPLDEDAKMSQRVEFRVITNTDELLQVLDSGMGGF